MSLKDQHYIDCIQQGDTNAYSVLIDRYKYMVFTLALKMVKRREEAEEISQDVFVKAYTALNTFKGESKFSTWLYKIAYYRSLDYLKKQKRSLQTHTIDSDTEYHLPAIENVMDTLELKERKKVIQEAIALLKEEDAVVITLHYFEELTLKEIAGIMNLDANTVKVRLYRSRKRLAVLLKNRLEPEILENYGRR